jgi:tRNA dimethylallyltransferase
MQAYRGMDIGTAKPSADIRSEIIYRMIDVADPSEDFDVRRYQGMGREAIDEELARRGRVIVCGGSGLHFRALVDPMTFAPTDPVVRAELEGMDLVDLVDRLLASDPSAGEIVDLDNPRRVIRAVEVAQLTGLTPTARATSNEAADVAEYRPHLAFAAVGIDPGGAVRKRVEARFDAMVAGGLLDEVAGLADSLGRTARQAVGYKELIPVVHGDATLAEATEEVLSATMSLVKRQRTFFRRDPRIEWLAWQDDRARRIDEAMAAIREAAGWTS